MFSAWGVEQMEELLAMLVANGQVTVTEAD